MSEAADSVATEEVEYSEVEQKAMEKGWNPDGVEGKRNLSAEEFLDRQTLYDDIHFLKKKNKELQQSFEALAEHNKTVKEKTRQKVIEELKEQKKQALREEDYDKIVEIDDQLLEARNTKTEDPVKVSNEAFDAWVEKNAWYTSDEEMKDEADTWGLGYAQSHPDTPPEKLYEMVEKRIKKLYPEKFSNMNREKPAGVEGGTARATGKKKPSAKDLSDEERQIMRTIVRTGVLTEEQYLEQLFN